MIVYVIRKIYPGEPVSIHIQKLINIIQENNWVITTKKSKGELPLFWGNGEQVIPIYSLWLTIHIGREGSVILR